MSLQTISSMAQKRKCSNRARDTPFGGLTRSELMARIRSSGNATTELKMVRLLRRHRLRGWRRNQRVYGRPDFVWRKERLALFVDGCFWHGHNCGRNLTPRRNAPFWAQKIRRNRQRDKAISRHLRSSGWVVLRVWECELSQRPISCARRIAKALGRGELRPGEN
jgi:DNA mismatch endonuclease, patch repair protein